MALWSTSPLTPFAGGTGTTVSADQTIDPPNQSRQMAFARVTTTQEAPAAAEASCVFGKFTGDSYVSTPAEILSNVCGPRLEATAAGGTYPADWYELNLNHPTTKYVFTVENMDSNAGDTENTLDIVWANVANGLPINRLFARETINTTLTGPTINLSTSGSGQSNGAGAAVRDLTTVMVPGGVVVADEEQTGRIFMESTGFNPANIISNSYVIHGIEATSGSTWTHPTRTRQNFPIISETSTVTPTLIETSGPTNPGTWAAGIGFFRDLITQ